MLKASILTPWWACWLCLMCPGAPDQTPLGIYPSWGSSASHRPLPLTISLWGWGWAVAESSFCIVTNVKNESVRIYKKTDCSLPAASVMFAAVSPSWLCLERGWVPDEPIQRGQDGLEVWPVPAISLPALKHQRVEGRGAVVRGREAILIRYRLHHLQRQSRGSVRHKSGRWFTSLV